MTFEEITYEGIGPGGVAFLVDVVTDNRNRTAGEIRKIFERGGGKMGSAGNVAFLFERKGLFSVNAAGVDEDTLMGIALDAGADDLKRAGSTFEITCDPSAFSKVQEALQKNNIATVVAEISQLAKAPIDADVEAAKKVLRLHEALDDHDDVQNVYTDLNMTEAILEKYRARGIDWFRKEVPMSSLTLPTALANARFLREALSERKGPFLSEEERELIQFCDIIAGLFRAFLRGVNESLAEGVGSRSLRAKLTEGITTAAEVREDCSTLQARLDLEPDAPKALAHRAEQRDCRDRSNSR